MINDYLKDSKIIVSSSGNYGKEILTGEEYNSKYTQIQSDIGIKMSIPKEDTPVNVFYNYGEKDNV